MLNLAVRNTKKLVRKQVKEENIRIGNRFTKKGNAALMSYMFDMPKKEEIFLLDAGAGTGILSAALVEHICNNGRGVKEIHLYCFENDSLCIEMLKSNLERVRKKCKHDFNIKLRVNILEEDFILSDKDGRLPKFDMAVLNPPCELAKKGSAYANAVSESVCATISTAYVFTQIALGLLDTAGQLVAYLPSDFAHGGNYAKFRDYIAEHSYIEGIHTFIRANNKKLYKNIIFKLVKANKIPECVNISSSYGDEWKWENEVLPPLPYEFVVGSNHHNLTLASSINDLKLYIFVAGQKNTLNSLGLTIKTGLTLEGRYPEYIKEESESSYVPLITPKNVIAGHIDFSREHKYINPIIPSLSQPNKNMLIIKRVPARSDNRHMVCAVYLRGQKYEYSQISTHNKLVYIDYKDDGREMDSHLLHGLYAVLSSTLYERYFSVISSSKTVNVAEYSSIPLPDEGVLRQIGSRLSMSAIFTSKACDNLVNNALGVDKSLLI